MTVRFQNASRTIIQFVEYSVFRIHKKSSISATFDFDVVPFCRRRTFPLERYKAVEVEPTHNINILDRVIVDVDLKPHCNGPWTFIWYADSGLEFANNNPFVSALLAENARETQKHDENVDR